ncbi:MAG: hypothetical protein ACFB0Z_04300 [Candidatus Phaeomarinobacter sp.]
MTQIVKQAAIGVGLALAAVVGPAVAADGVARQPVSSVVLPQESEALRSLEHQHRRIVRTAIRQCASGLTKQRGIIVNPCIISGVIRGVEQSGDPQLAAYDQALPMQARFDDRRPQSIWRTVAKRNAEATQVN